MNLNGKDLFGYGTGITELLENKDITGQPLIRPQVRKRVKLDPELFPKQ